jgi:AAA family ATP:ADP antiporter
VQLDMDEVTDSTTRATLMRTIAGIARVGAPDRPSAAVTVRTVHGTADASPEPRIGRLRSRDPARVRAALAEGPLEPSMVPVVIGLAAWDEVAPAALVALQGVAAASVGALVTSLLDPDEEFTVRRRIPSVLTKAPSADAVRGLTEGLRDARFEVRFRCGRALARILSEDPSLAVAEERIHAAVLREVAVERPVWESQRLLDRSDEEDVQAGFVDDVVRDRASRSLEHVFTLLSLVMPPRPLRIAFRGLYAEDPQLRGTALEYLEVAMPAAVRDRLWPFLDDRPRRAGATSRPREEIMAALFASSDYIARDLETSRGNPPRR